MSAGEWVSYDEQKCQDSVIEMVVQVNGKIKTKLKVSVEITKEQAIAAAKSDEKVIAAIEGKTIIKEIYVPGKLINIVIK